MNANAQEFIPDNAQTMSPDKRYFVNQFKSWNQVKAEKSDIMKKCIGNVQTVITALSPHLEEEFIDYIASFVQYICKEYNPDFVEQCEFRCSVYIGIGGFCILFLRIIQIMDTYEKCDKKQANDDDNDVDMKQDDLDYIPSKYELSAWNSFMTKLCKICNSNNTSELRNYLLRCIVTYNNCALDDFESRKHQRYSFLEGISGAYGIRIVYYFLMQNDARMNKYIQKLKHLSAEVEKLDAMELLYGRMGYVSTYLFIHQFIGDYNELDLLECNEVLSICQSVIEEGKQYVSIANDISKHDFLKNNNIPMIWEWHESAYFGGAHGAAGIISVLISIPSVFNKNKAILTQMLECCQSFKFKSGNYASSMRGYYKQRDSLVQLCHGATGFIPMYVTANKVMKEDKYVKYAIDAQHIVWNRGLLTKGPGLCHGVGGNGYTFLSCYRMCDAKELQYLYRAMRFAQFLVDKNTKFPKKPDRPDSLFEGKCGGVIFVFDTLFASQNAAFPCYEWL